MSDDLLKQLFGDLKSELRDARKEVRSGHKDLSEKIERIRIEQASNGVRINDLERRISFWVKHIVAFWGAVFWALWAWIKEHVKSI